MAQRIVNGGFHLTVNLRVFLEPSPNCGSIVTATVCRNGSVNNWGSAAYHIMITDGKNARLRCSGRRMHRICSRPSCSRDLDLCQRTGNGDRIQQNRGMQGQDMDHEHRIQNVVLLLFLGIVP